MTPKTLRARIQTVRDESDCVRSFHLVPEAEDAFPAFDAGAHIDLHLENGMVRAYSLCSRPGDASGYRIAVSFSGEGRGGSRYIYEQLKEGACIAIGAPRNHFALSRDRAPAVLVAGGIGITPVWSMVQQLEAEGRQWALYYAARRRGAAAFLDALQAVAGQGHGRVVTSFGDDQSRSRLDLQAIVQRAPRGTHFYCCGPERMIEAFRRATEALPPEQVHVEFFAGQAQSGVQQGFTVELARSGKVISVEPGSTILEAVEAAGVMVPHACKEGVCAACETRVLGGIPDHRDLVLSKQEKSENRTIMICCSGALSERLVLDL